MHVISNPNIPKLSDTSYALTYKAYGTAPCTKRDDTNLYIPNPRMSRYHSFIVSNSAVTEFRFPKQLPLKLLPVVRGTQGENNRDITDFERYLRHLSRPLLTILDIETIQSTIVDNTTGQEINNEEYEDLVSAHQVSMDSSENIHERKTRLAFNIAGTALLPEINDAGYMSIYRMTLHPPTLAQQAAPLNFNLTTLEAFK